MLRSILFLLLGCVVLPTFLVAQSANDATTKPEFVMILSSYSYDKEWSTTLAKNIRNQLEKQRPNLKTNITYAGIAAHTSFLADRFAMQGAFGQGRLSNKISRPNVLVLIGDESWMLYRIMNHRGIWEKIPVVLCGMHTEVLENYEEFFPRKQFAETPFISLEYSMTTSALQTTAVVEPDNTFQTLKLAHTLVPNLHHLYYLSDGSYADCYMREKLFRATRQQSVSFTEIQIKRNNTDSIKRVLATLPLNAVVVTNDTPISENISVPVIALRDMPFWSSASVGGFFAPISAFADKTVKAVSHILETGKVNDSSYTIVSDTAYYLDQTALMNANLYSAIKTLPHVVYRNVPPPFIIRHIRTISVLSLVMIVVVFVLIRGAYARRYRRKMNGLLERYRTLYDEYQVVYENMPVGLMLFDTSGNLLKSNAETNVFLEQFTDSENPLFHLFDFGILDDYMREALLRKELVSKLLYFEEYCYRILCSMIVDEETGTDQILVIAVDNTDIDKERKAKEQIYNVLNFAMNKANIGVAEYNLIDGVGFATDAWYDMFDMKHDSINFLEVRKCLISVDQVKLNDYFEKVRNGSMELFWGILQIQIHADESHYIRVLIQPLECDLEKGRIIIAELILNVDEEIAREHELESAMKKAQEADRFKNAFVVNMQDEIRVPLEEVLSCAQKLVATTDLQQRNKLNSRIETGNSRMLELLNEIIEVSKIELNE